MAVYVDKLKTPCRGMKMSYMLADTPAELHAMADRVGRKRQWFQNDRVPHYDICQAKRRLAIEAGAIEIGRRETVALAASSDLALRHCAEPLKRTRGKTNPIPETAEHRRPASI